MKLCLAHHFVPFPAYRLKKCPVPPGVENAEMIYEDDNFQIGKRQHHFRLFIFEYCTAFLTETNTFIQCIS